MDNLEQNESREYRDSVFLIALLICFIVCYHRLSLLSHRIDMVIMVQQSQQKYIDKLMENK